MTYIPSSLLSSSIIKLNCYARSLRRPDKPPSKIPSLANTSPEKYSDHEGLTSRGWYYPRVVAAKSPGSARTNAWLKQIVGGDQRSGQQRPCASWLSLISRSYPEPFYYPRLYFDARDTLNGTYPREELMRLETCCKIRR